MACFLVPAGEAIVATVVKKVEEKKEVTSEKKEEVKIPFSQKLKWLTSLLWGGAILLAFALVIWVLVLLISDPKGTVRKAIKTKNDKKATV